MKFHIRSLLWLIASWVLIFSCQRKDLNFNTATASYIFDTLNVEKKVDEDQYFLILNPNNNCIGCYKSSYMKIQELRKRNDVQIITDEKTARIINNRDDKNLIIDYKRNIFRINPNQRISNKFLVVKNGRIREKVILHADNIDTLDFLVKEK